jgi:hypothetical protein
MAQKKLWVAWMAESDSQGGPREIIAKLGKYGFVTQGSDWVDDLPKMAWSKTAEVLVDPSGVDGCVIAGPRAQLTSTSNRQALSLLMCMTRGNRGAAFPFFLICTDASLTAEDLPLLVRDAALLSAQDAGWPAKIVAGMARPAKSSDLGFHLAVHAHPMIGQFFEVGPESGEWPGALFGVAGDARITHHAVAPRGEVPERGTVEYELAGLEATVQDRQFVAWAAKNRLTPEQSYFLRVEGTPAALLVGNYPDEDTEPMASVIPLDG